MTPIERRFISGRGSTGVIVRLFAKAKQVFCGDHAQDLDPTPASARTQVSGADYGSCVQGKGAEGPAKALGK